MNEREGGLMNLNALAIGGLIAAVVIIIVSVTLINKFASGD
jgi:hypothetical protein